MDPYLSSNNLRQLSNSVNDDTRDNLGIVNTDGITNLRIHKRGYIQYSMDNGKSWHNSSKQFLNLFVDDNDDPDPVDPGIGQIEFKTHTEFPNIGKANMLYVATDENTIYRYDSVKEIYVILNNILDIKVIQGIIK